MDAPGRDLAHLREICFAAPMVEALHSSGISFHILAIMFVANIGKPGTGGQILFEVSDLVVLKFDFSLNKSWPGVQKVPTFPNCNSSNRSYSLIQTL